MNELLFSWLQAHQTMTLRDYLLFSLWGLLVGLAWTQITKQRLVLPHRDGLNVQLGFLGTLLVAVVMSMLIDYAPVLAGAGTFAMLVLVTMVSPMVRSAQHSDGKLLAIHQSNLHQLEIIAARYGIDCPPWVLNAIEHEEAQIARLHNAT